MRGPVDASMLEDLIQLHRSGRLDEAEAGYRKFLSERPDDPEALHLFGILRAQRGDVEEGLRLVSRAAELAPENAACRHTLGEMYLSQGRLDEAGRAYEEARRLNPNLAGAFGGLGQVALLRGDVDAAESHFKVALRADENDVQALTGLGNVAKLRGDSARALQLLTQAAGLAPDDPMIQTSYAQAMLEQDMLDFAARALDNALAVKPGYPLARALRAEIHVRKHEFDAATPVFESLLARGEQPAAAHAGLGDIARAQGRFAAAVPHYDEALRLRPDFHLAAIRRADALARGGNAEQAIDDLRAHLAAHPDSVKAHIALASLLSQRARHDEALEVWGAAEKRWPADINVKAQHALELDRAGRPSEALELAEAAAASPRPALALLRARGSLLAGDPAAAVQRLQHIDAARLRKAPPRLARRRERLLGLAYDALEQWPEAVAAFLRAQAAGSHRLPDLPPVDDALRAALRAPAEAAPAPTVDAAAPVFLCGLPGSGVGQVAALLADQPGWFVRRDRFGAAPDFITAPFDARLLQPLDGAALDLLARRWRRPIERAQLAPGTRVVDWLPVLDARVAPALARALPGARLVQVARDPHDALLDWLAFGWSEPFVLADLTAGAHWQRVAAAHLGLAAERVPALRVDPDALLAPDGDAARAQLAGFLGVAGVVPGPLAAAARTGRGGLPSSFPAGHSRHYREQLADAFAALDD